jgi:hypothetical protein
MHAGRREVWHKKDCVRSVLAGYALVALGLCTACPRARSDDPVEAYQAFVKSTQKGEAKAAWSFLSAATRTEVEARSHALAAASDGGVRDDPTALLFVSLQRPEPVSEISLQRRDDAVATVRVSTASRTAEVRLVKEDGAWKVDLTDALK